MGLPAALDYEKRTRFRRWRLFLILFFLIAAAICGTIFQGNIRSFSVRHFQIARLYFAQRKIANFDLPKNKLVYSDDPADVASPPTGYSTGMNFSYWESDSRKAIGFMPQK